MKTRLVLPVLGLAAVAAMSASLGQQAATESMHDAHATHRAAMKSPRYAIREQQYDIPDVHLIAADGSTSELSAILDSDQPVALNFIFTTCTTICPVMTATFAQMQRQLAEKADEVRLVSISIDPEYDRPDVLKAYAEQFHAGGNWMFLTGDSPDIEKVLRSFDSYAGSKMNHKAVTLLKRPDHAAWIRIDGLANGESLAQEVTARLLN
ncbi:MAG: SCO family protein [Gammaproteobacteria bacterium]|nr:SCO family protein [Gammaproteobacteria bacterium]MDH5303783.1 SCO family protein [Gammaproteobacteria bacterium]MDH5322191.1 SCO family protein [Gammaproteobacteria bacterium]